MSSERAVGCSCWRERWCRCSATSRATCSAAPARCSRSPGIGCCRRRWHGSTRASTRRTWRSSPMRRSSRWVAVSSTFTELAIVANVAILTCTCCASWRRAELQRRDVRSDGTPFVLPGGFAGPAGGGRSDPLAGVSGDDPGADRRSGGPDGRRACVRRTEITASALAVNTEYTECIVVRGSLSFVVVDVQHLIELRHASKSANRLLTCCSVRWRPAGPPTCRPA